MSSVSGCGAFTSTQHPHSATASVTIDGGKGKRKMCEPELPVPSTPPKTSPHFQLPSPETSSRYCHRLLQRMQTDTCFRCRRQGHWARDCPLNSPNSKSHAPIAENFDFPKIYCRCGHGFCEVKKAKNDRNYGKSYYTCPIKMGRKCKDFVQWCEDPIDESLLRPPSYKYPTCSCNAGVCRKEKVTSGPNEGRYFFACPISEDHGACNFRLWEDTMVGSPNIASVKQSGQRTLHDYWDSKEVDKININDLGQEVGSPSVHSKRMRIIGNSEYSSVMAISELPEGEDPASKEVPIERGDHDETTELSTPPNHAGFLEFEADNDIEDLAMINSVPREAIEEKGRSISQLSRPSMIGSQQQSQRTLHDFWEGKQLEKININNSDSLLCLSKMIRIAGDSEYSLVMAASELPEGEDSTQTEGRNQDDTESTPPNVVGFPEFEADDDIDVICMIDPVLWEAIEKKAQSISHLSTSSKIHSRQEEFQRQISPVADTFFADPGLGWLGRLVFCHPTLSLKFPQPEPFFCCVFPSFNAIMVPRQESGHDGLGGKSNQFSINNLSQHVQLSIGSQIEISGDIASPNTSPGSGRRLILKAWQNKMVLILQKELLQQLESLSPLDYESMREAAEVTFNLLNNLSVDHRKFSEHVWEFINSTSSLAKIQSSIQNGISLEEYIRRYEELKVRLAGIHDNYVKTKASLEVSQQHSQSLQEEASRLKAMLHVVEDQLASSKLETKKMETHLGEINASLMEVEESLKIAAEQADTARKHIEEREAKQIAAMAALENAKLELGKQYSVS